MPSTSQCNCWQHDQQRIWLEIQECCFDGFLLSWWIHRWYQEHFCYGPNCAHSPEAPKCQGQICCPSLHRSNQWRYDRGIPRRVRWVGTSNSNWDPERPSAKSICPLLLSNHQLHGWCHWGAYWATHWNYFSNSCKLDEDWNLYLKRELCDRICIYCSCYQGKVQSSLWWSCWSPP